MGCLELASTHTRRNKGLENYSGFSLQMGASLAAQPKYSRHTAHIQPTYSPHTARIQPAYIPHTAHIQPTYSPHTAHIYLTYSPLTALIQPTYSPCKWQESVNSLYTHRTGNPHTDLARVLTCCPAHTEQVFPQPSGVDLYYRALVLTLLAFVDLGEFSHPCGVASPS